MKKMTEEESDKTKMEKGDIKERREPPPTNSKEDIIKSFKEGLTIEEQFEVYRHTLSVHPYNNNNRNEFKGTDTHCLYSYLISDIQYIPKGKERGCLYTLSLIGKVITEIPTIIATQNINKACALVFALRYKNIYPNLLDPILGSHKSNHSSYSFALQNLAEKRLLIKVGREDQRYLEERERIIRALKARRRTNRHNDKETVWYILSKEGEGLVGRYLNELLNIIPGEIRKRLNSENPLKNIIGRTHEEVEKLAQKRIKEENLRLREIDEELQRLTKEYHRDFYGEFVKRAKETKRSRLEIAEEMLNEVKNGGIV